MNLRGRKQRQFPTTPYRNRSETDRNGQEGEREQTLGKNSKTKRTKTGSTIKGHRCSQESKLYTRGDIWGSPQLGRTKEDAQRTPRGTTSNAAGETGRLAGGAREMRGARPRRRKNRLPFMGSARKTRAPPSKRETKGRKKREEDKSSPEGLLRDIKTKRLRVKRQRKSREGEKTPGGRH